MIRGLCLTARGGGRDAPVALDRCRRSAAGRWVRGPDGELLNASSGLCLADPGNSAAVGRKLVPRVCYEEPGELWQIR
jgi:hypothetical protein